MTTRARSGPRRRVAYLGDRDRETLGRAIRDALAAAGGDLEVVAGCFGLPQSALLDLLGDTEESSPRNAGSTKQRASKR